MKEISEIEVAFKLIFTSEVTKLIFIQNENEKAY
jgi:hypothetical protein